MTCHVICHDSCHVSQAARALRGNNTRRAVVSLSFFLAKKGGLEFAPRIFTAVGARRVVCSAAPSGRVIVGRTAARHDQSSFVTLSSQRRPCFCSHRTAAAPRRPRNHRREPRAEGFPMALLIEQAGGVASTGLFDGQVARGRLRLLTSMSFLPHSSSRSLPR